MNNRNSANDRRDRWQLEFSSQLTADAAEVLAHASTMAGVNAELWPLLRMTVPRAYQHRSLLNAPTGERLFRSFLCLGGLLPIDWDDLVLESVDVDTGFQESSSMLSMRSWRHERRVYAEPSGGCQLVDRLEFVPRIPRTGGVLRYVVGVLFEHRHKRLRRIFG